MGSKQYSAIVERTCVHTGIEVGSTTRIMHMMMMQRVTCTNNIIDNSKLINVFINNTSAFEYFVRHEAKRFLKRRKGKIINPTIAVVGGTPLGWMGAQLL